jgi:hypothetical protein
MVKAKRMKEIKVMKEVESSCGHDDEIIHNIRTDAGAHTASVGFFRWGKAERT